MDRTDDSKSLLELIAQPAFLVEGGKITAVNESARQRMICAGTEIASLLPDHGPDYEAFEEGILYLSVRVGESDFDATVTRTQDGDIFVLDTRFANDALQALALASQHLRSELGNIMAAAQEKAVRNGSILRGLYRMHRSLCNMSDIPMIRSAKAPTQMLELGSAVYEIAEKAATLLASSDIKVTYDGPQESIHTTADYELLERAVYNLLSNAAKFSEKGSTLQVRLQKKGACALLTIEDPGTGISASLYRTLFSRYQREPSIEDGHHGVGLGLALVQAVAAHHGGTILLTASKCGGTKITLSIAIRTPDDTVVRSPLIRLSDYAGGIDHGLLELSDVLPADLFIM